MKCKEILLCDSTGFDATLMSFKNTESKMFSLNLKVGQFVPRKKKFRDF